jgi:hypothetical protein
LTAVKGSSNDSEAELNSCCMILTNRKSTIANCASLEVIASDLNLDSLAEVNKNMICQAS